MGATIRIGVLSLLGVLFEPQTVPSAESPVADMSITVLADGVRRREPNWMEFLPTGKHIGIYVSTLRGVDGEILVYDAKTGQRVASCRTKPNGGTQIPLCIASPTGEWIGYGHDGNGLRFLAIPPRKPALADGRVLHPKPKAASDAPRTNTIWVDNRGKEVFVADFADEGYRLVRWDLASGAIRTLLSGSSWSANNFDLNPFATRFALVVQRQFGVRQQEVEVWSLDTPRPKQTIIPRPDGPRRLDPMSLKLSPDGKTLAVGYGDGSVGLWATDSGKLIHHVRLQAQFTIAALAFDPLSRYVACGSLDHSGRENLFLIETESGKVIASLAVDTRGVLKTGFSPTGDRLAVFGSSGKVTIWDATKLLKLNGK